MTARPNFKTRIEITDSDWIDNIQYDPITLILDANLRNGTRYRYVNVWTDTFAQVVTAKSSGRAFNRLVKGKFQSRKLPALKNKRLYLTER